MRRLVDTVRASSRRSVLAVGAALTLALALFVGLQTGADRPATPDAPTVAKAVDARFAVLSDAHSNQCGMPASELRSMPDRKHLRGSCCFPMDEARYVEQLHGLREYAALRVVPADPYDIPLTFAKRLLAYRRIDLTPRQQAVYTEARAKSDLGGPCCCPCWRWQAFKGQASFLIARRYYTAEQIASLWDLEEGCGGPADET